MAEELRWNSPWCRGAWLELYRTQAGPTGVAGKMLGCLQPIDFGEQGEGLQPLKKLCKTIERPWVDNKPRVSCIPDGIYPLRYKTDGRFYARYKKKYGHPFVLHIDRVPSRSHILPHMANDPMKDLLGCVGIVTETKMKHNKSLWGTASEQAYKYFMKWVRTFRPAYIKVSGLADLVLDDRTPSFPNLTK